jgi:hypothetical protein
MERSVHTIQMSLLTVTARLALGLDTVLSTLVSWGLKPKKQGNADREEGLRHSRMRRGLFRCRGRFRKTSKDEDGRWWYDGGLNGNEARGSIGSSDRGGGPCVEKGRTASRDASTAVRQYMKARKAVRQNNRKFF